MGDFVGGMLKYLRSHPVPRVTIAGGIAKMSKLAEGRLDLHSKRGAVDFGALARLSGVPAVAGCTTVAEAFLLPGTAQLGDKIAQAAWRRAADVIADTDMALEIICYDRTGNPIGHAAFHGVRNRLT
jgi:cobalt-precorrin-5B (C1)-methyltransferase